MPKVKINSAKCTGEGTCVSVCPVNVFRLKSVNGKKKSVAVNEKDCIGCRSCEAQCPKKAIRIED